MSLLERSPKIAPLLLRLYDCHKLYGLARDTDPDARVALTSVMVDLLNVDLSERETELITDVLISLTRQAQKDLRAALSERLADAEKAPLRLVLQLANDEIDVADFVLRLSPVLQDMDLIYIIKSKGTEHWQSIARRHGLNNPVIDTLAETRDEPTAIVLSENYSVDLTEKAIEIFSEMAKESDDVAEPLLMRDELPVGVASILYQHVGKELKTYIKAHYDLSPDIIDEAVDDIVQEFVNVERKDFTPSKGSLEVAEKQVRHGELTMSSMMGTLKRGQIPTFAAQFAMYCGLPIPTIMELIKQPTGQGLAIACKAVQIQKADFISIFLMTHQARAGEDRIVSQNALSRAMQYFDKIKREDAIKILNQSRN